MLEALTCCTRPSSDTDLNHYAQPVPSSAASQGKKPTFASYRIKTGRYETLTVDSGKPEYSALLQGQQLRVTRRVDKMKATATLTEAKRTITKERLFRADDESLLKQESTRFSADYRLELNQNAITASLSKEKERANQQQTMHYASLAPSQWVPQYIEYKCHRAVNRLLHTLNVKELRWLGNDHTYHPAHKKSETIGLTRTTQVTAQTRAKGHDTTSAAIIRANGKVYSLVAVYDGHGSNWGLDSSQEVARKLPNELQTRLQALSQVMQPEAALVNTLKTGFVAVDNDLGANSGCGSTACLALIDGQTVTLANVGDSRAVMIRHTSAGHFTAEQLTTDHKTLDPHSIKSMDKRRGEAAIPDNYRSHPHGSTRKFGDLWTPGISARPKVTQTTMTSEDYLVLGCDGVWDYLLPEQLAQLITLLTQAGFKTPDQISTKILAFVREAHEHCKRNEIRVHPDDLSITVTQLHKETEV